MALTQGAWNEYTVNGHYAAYCDVTSTTSEELISTLPTPSGLDTSKSYLLVANSASVTMDATSAVIPVDIYAGYTDSFALNVATDTLTVVDGAQIANNIMADVRTAVGSVIVDPTLQIANAADVICRGSAGKHAYTATAASVLSAATTRFVVMQESGKSSSLSIAGIGADPS
jgi:hypothetical protein